MDEFSFHVGYPFYYWDYYKDGVDQHKAHFGNKRDFMGYKTYELYVESKYSSLKEEILENKIHHLSMYEFLISNKKLSKYMETDKVKSSKSAAHCEKKLHYGISTSTEMSAEHLLAIMLRCDWTDMCSKLSATFPKSKPTESLKSVKARNSEYAIWSRLLRETVEYYGHRSHGDDPESDIVQDEFVKINKVSGPFYCGMSNVLRMSQFNIRINSPLSTSKELEVAYKFAERYGIIIQLNNVGHKNAKHLRTFPCHWISDYSEENEYLFAGGQYSIKVESIRIVQTSKNYAEFCDALFYFDCILKGNPMPDDLKINDKEIFYTLRRFINHKLKVDVYQNKFGLYMNQTFDAFVKNRADIFLNLWHLNDNFGVLKHLLLNIKYSVKKDCKLFMIRDVIFRLFKNVKHIMMHTTNHDGDPNEDCKLDLRNLLKLLNSSLVLNINGFRMTIKGVHDEYGHNQPPSWLYYEFINLKNEEFSNDYLMHMIETKDIWNTSEDCLVIRSSKVIIKQTRTTLNVCWESFNKFKTTIIKSSVIIFSILCDIVNEEFDIYLAKLIPQHIKDISNSLIDFLHNILNEKQNGLIFDGWKIVRHIVTTFWKLAEKYDVNIKDALNDLKTKMSTLYVDDRNVTNKLIPEFTIVEEPFTATDDDQMTELDGLLS